MQIDILLQAENLSRICSFCYDSNNLLISDESSAKNNMNIITENETSYINHDSDDNKQQKEDGSITETVTVTYDEASSNLTTLDITYGFFSRSHDPSLKYIPEGAMTTTTSLPDDNIDNDNDNNSMSSTQSFYSPTTTTTSPSDKNNNTKDNDSGNDSKVKVVKYSEVRDASPNIVKELDVSSQHLNDVKQLRSVLSSSGANELLSDEDCLRFLKSKNYHVPKTAEMIKQWFQWRNTPLPGFTNVMPKNILTYVNDKESIAADLLLHANYGEDKEGHPIYWEKTGFGELMMIL